MGTNYAKILTQKKACRNIGDFVKYFTTHLFSTFSRIKLFKIFIFFFYCSSIVVSIFPPPLPPSHPSPSPTLILHLLWLCPCVLCTCSLMTLPLFPFCFPRPFCLLSVCSLFQRLWIYVACLFVLLIRFHIYVRSYGICLLPPGLHHLA